jgi:hypothetical protein
MDTLKKLAGTVFVAALFGFFCWWLGGDLLSDFTHRNEKFEVVRDAEIVEAKCKSKLFVLSFCDIKAKGTGIAEGTREFGYFILGGVGDDGVSLQRAAGAGPAKDRYLTTTTGVDFLVTRIISFAILMGLIGAALIGSLFALFRGTAVDGA